MSLAAAGDAVAHSGQAVTLPAARGQHLFTRTKRFLMDWARERGLAGMFSEATAAHPYSQRANIELGAHETGFLLGWIPASVANDAAAGGAAAAPVGGALLHQAERRPRAPGLRAASATARSSARRWRSASCAARLAEPPPDAELARAHRAARRGRRGPQPGPDHRPRARRRPGGGDRRRAPPPLPPRRPRRDLHRPAAGARRRRRWSPTTSSASASPTPASSPTAAPTATCCGCSRCTGSESRPTTSPSPRTTGASCSTTSSPTSPSAT